MRVHPLPLGFVSLWFDPCFVCLLICVFVLSFLHFFSFFSTLCFVIQCGCSLDLGLVGLLFTTRLFFFFVALSPDFFLTITCNPCMFFFFPCVANLQSYLLVIYCGNIHLLLNTATCLAEQVKLVIRNLWKSKTSLHLLFCRFQKRCSAQPSTMHVSPSAK